MCFPFGKVKELGQRLLETWGIFQEILAEKNLFCIEKNELFFQESLLPHSLSSLRYFSSENTA